MDTRNSSLSKQTLCALLLILLSSSRELLSEAFRFSQGPAINPSISEYSLNQNGKALNLNLEISNPEALPMMPTGGSKIYIRDLELQFGSEPPTVPLNLPGANGPTPQHSTGPFSLETKNPGSFISLSGQKSLPIANAAWEMIWKEFHPAGSIIRIWIWGVM